MLTVELESYSLTQVNGHCPLSICFHEIPLRTHY